MFELDNGTIIIAISAIAVAAVTIQQRYRKKGKKVTSDDTAVSVDKIEYSEYQKILSKYKRRYNCLFA